MRRRELLQLIGGAAALWPLAARAQQPSGRIARIACLAPARIDHLLQAFLRGLADLGYVDGRDIIIEYRFAEGRPDRLDALAAEAVQTMPDVIVAVGVAAGIAAHRATNSIPIVLAPAGDPVRSGLVASLASPGGNVTGMSLYATELNQKRLELLKEAVPGIRRVAVLIDSGNPQSSEYWRETQDAGDRLGLETHLIRAKGLATLDADFAAIEKARLDALAVTPSGKFDSGRQRIVHLAAKYRLPAIYEHRAFVDAGGLLSYGPNIDQLSYRAAAYVGKILKDAKPADLPIEQPTKLELAINLKTAKALGLAVPPIVLAQTDEVVE